MRRILFCGFIWVCFMGEAGAQDVFGPVNTGAANFLTIQTNARNAGMGGVGVAIPNGNDAVFYNAATTLLKESSVGGATYSFSPWMHKFESGYSLNSLGGFYRIDKRSALLAGFRYFNYPECEILGLPDVVIDKIHPKEWAVDLGYTRELLPSFMLSATIRYIHSDLGKLEKARKANAVAVDIGMVYKRDILFLKDANWTAGLQVSNIGSKVKYLNTKENLPTLAKLGGSVTLPFSPGHKLMAACDLGYRFTPGSFNLSAGAEYTLMEYFLFRGGYHYGNEKKGDTSYATIGTGLSYSGAILDFSWLFAKSDSPINNTFWISLGFSF